MCLQCTYIQRDATFLQASDLATDLQTIFCARYVVPSADSALAIAPSRLSTGWSPVTHWLVPTATHWLVLTNTTPDSVLPDRLRTLFQLPAPLRPQHQDRIATCHGLCPHDRHSELRHTRQPAAPSGGISCRDDRRTAPLAVTSTDRPTSGPLRRRNWPAVCAVLCHGTT